jgi:CRP-like cAMP-binding protein
MTSSLRPPQKFGRPRALTDSRTLLRAHAIFGGLDPVQIERLGGLAHMSRVPAGTTLFAKGDPGTALYAVAAGTVKIVVPSIDGREAMFTLLHAGEIFGEIALLDGMSRTADAVALTDCELMMIERRDFLTFMHSEPNVAFKLIGMLCARLRSADKYLEEVMLMPMPARLARLLLRLNNEDGVSPTRRKLKITQRELSQMLGTTRESVNKYLSIWARCKWIKPERGGIVVVTPEPLSQIADGANADDLNAAEERRSRVHAEG